MPIIETLKTKIIGTNVTQLYFNKVENSLSKTGISCLGYEMIAVAKI